MCEQNDRTKFVPGNFNDTIAIQNTQVVCTRHPIWLQQEGEDTEAAGTPSARRQEVMAKSPNYRTGHDGNDHHPTLGRLFNRTGKELQKLQFEMKNARVVERNTVGGWQEPEPGCMENLLGLLYPE